MIKRQIKICYIAGRESSYSRTRNVLAGLKKAGFEVITCFPSDKSFRHYPGLIWKFFKAKRGCDLIVVGFYGQLLFPFVRLLTWKPILYDVYISTFDTMVYDRGVAKSTSLKAKLYWLFDWFSMKCSHAIILETQDHIEDYAKKFKISIERFRHLFLTVDESVIHPVESNRSEPEFLVHFHGEYAPFHGVRIILEAAHLLRDKHVQFQIIGKGITWKADRDFAEKAQLNNVRFIDWVPYEQLAKTMAKADCSLGFFGKNPRTARVLTNKVVETLAVGKPLITVENQPVQELVIHEESALLVPAGDAAALANAILKLKSDPKLKNKLAENGHRAYLEKCSMDVFSSRLNTIVNELVEQ